MRRTGLGIIAAAVLLGTAGPSQAATAGVVGYGKYFQSSRLYVAAAPGELNHIVVTQTMNGIRVTDAQPVTAGGWCESERDGSALCRAVPRTSLNRVGVDLGDRDDSIQVHLDNAVGTRLVGGAGDDVMTATDTSSVVFVGGPGNDRMTGGLGADLFLEGPDPNGSDLMVGGGEPLTIPLNASFHRDEVSYEERSTAVHADLDGDRDDGARGERDHIGSDVESLAGGDGPDALLGDVRANALDGGRGPDLLLAGRGNDHLIGGPNNDASSDRLLAGPGSDYLYGGGGPDRLYGGGSSDEVRGGAGRDLVLPGRGLDLVFGGPGNDILRTRDRAGEIVECGGGFDRAFPDRFDELTVECERDLSR